jgi:molybdopterin converting factor small subunit
MITVHLPTDLAEAFKAQPVIEVAADSLPEMVAALDAHYPGMAHWLTDADGQFRQHLSVFVRGRRVATRDGSTPPLSPGEEVWVLRAVSGG